MAHLAVPLVARSREAASSHLIGHVLRRALRLQAVEAVLRDALLAHLVRVGVGVRVRARSRVRVKVRVRVVAHRLRRVVELIGVLAGELSRTGADDVGGRRRLAAAERADAADLVRVRVTVLGLDSGL